MVLANLKSLNKYLYEGESHIGIVRGQADWKGKKIHLFRDMMYLVDKEIQENMYGI